MTKEETWGIAIDRARAFFREQEDVQEENQNLFLYGTCRVTLTELKPKGMGVWAAKRTKVVMEGEDADVEEIEETSICHFIYPGGICRLQQT